LVKAFPSFVVATSSWAITSSVVAWASTLVLATASSWVVAFEAASVVVKSQAR